MIPRPPRSTQSRSSAASDVYKRQKLPSWWSPFNPLCEQCKRISAAHIVEHMAARNSVKYICQCGAEGVADYSIGQGKLAWRIHWPARWKILGVTIEPFGKDHAVSGGSYDTGQRISCLLYTSDAADDLLCVDLGGRR